MKEQYKKNNSHGHCHHVPKTYPIYVNQITNYVIIKQNGPTFQSGPNNQLYFSQLVQVFSYTVHLRIPFEYQALIDRMSCIIQLKMKRDVLSLLYQLFPDNLDEIVASTLE